MAAINYCYSLELAEYKRNVIFNFSNTVKSLANVHPKTEGCAVVSLHPDVYSLPFSALGNSGLPLCLRKGESVQRNIYIDSTLVILPTPGAHRSEAKLTSLLIRLIFPSTRSIRDKKYIVQKWRNGS